MNALTVKSISPLFEYWQSKQEDKDNLKRLSLSNNNSPASFLFVNEPYKWEILYQSTMNDILEGDLAAIPALKILLGTLKEKVRIEFIDKLIKNQFFDREIIHKIANQTIEISNKSRPILKKIIILIFIFINPYGIDLKGKKKHIYEYTGANLHRIRKLYLKNR